MTDLLTYNLYADGGCILVNPSPYGGTYGWILVDGKGKRVEYGSGIIVPKTGEKITNNYAELHAALSALEYVLKKYPTYRGNIWTDSRCTFYRLQPSSYAFKGIPKEMKSKCISLRRNRKWVPMHLGGHPTKEDLERGYDDRGLIVSKNNVFCDDECKRLARLFINKHGIVRGEPV